MVNILAADYFVPDSFIDLNDVKSFYGLNKHELNVFTRLYGLKKNSFCKELGIK